MLYNYVEALYFCHQTEIRIATTLRRALHIAHHFIKHPYIAENVVMAYFVILDICPPWLAIYKLEKRLTKVKYEKVASICTENGVLIFFISDLTFDTCVLSYTLVGESNPLPLIKTTYTIPKNHLYSYQSQYKWKSCTSICTENGVMASLAIFDIWHSCLVIYLSGGKQPLHFK